MSVNLCLAEEMEAAEALAGLCRFAEGGGGSEDGGSGRKWRDANGKRRMEGELVKVESSPSCPDLCQSEMNGNTESKQRTQMDSVAFLDQKRPTAVGDISEVPVKSEQDSILPDDRNQMCGTSYLPLGGGRSRHNLSEAEMEAKRIRRVLANRESARRTIRRRQALCEDLTRRAAELTEENQRLKKGKELALKEYKSLETTNKHLKAKVASTVLKPTVLDASASSTNFPMLPYHLPLGPVFWPSIIHSSTHENCQEGRSDTTLVTPSIIMPGLCRSDLAREKEKLLNMAGTGSPVYIGPCPWFISLHNPRNECWSATCGNRRNLNEVALGNQTYGSSSSGADSQTENRTFDLSIEVKAEPPDPLINDLNEAPVESSSIGSGQSNLCLRLTGRSLESGSEAKGENGICLGLNCASFEAVPFESGKQDNVRRAGVHPNKNPGKAITAAKARRRRREITKLKSVDRRQCRT